MVKRNAISTAHKIICTGNAPAQNSPLQARESETITDLEQARLKTVRDHMALEITHEWDAVIDTFAHPRYELYRNGTVFDGEEAVRKYFAMSRTPFPDQANEVIAIGPAGEHVVLVEFWLTGTHLGPLTVDGTVIEPTGKSFRVRMAASFEFAPGTDRIICERAFFGEGMNAKALGL